MAYIISLNTLLWQKLQIIITKDQSGPVPEFFLGGADPNLPSKFIVQSLHDDNVIWYIWERACDKCQKNTEYTLFICHFYWAKIYLSSNWCGHFSISLNLSNNFSTSNNVTKQSASMNSWGVTSPYPYGSSPGASHKTWDNFLWNEYTRILT